MSWAKNCGIIGVMYMLQFAKDARMGRAGQGPDRRTNAGSCGSAKGRRCRLRLLPVPFVLCCTNFAALALLLPSAAQFFHLHLPCVPPPPALPQEPTYRSVVVLYRSAPPAPPAAGGAASILESLLGVALLAASKDWLAIDAALEAAQVGSGFVWSFCRAGFWPMMLLLS